MHSKAPPADPGPRCPFWQKDVSKVCHLCPLYIHMRGTNKNTGDDVDDWGCALGFLPMLLIENAAIENRTGAAIESFRNEMVNANQRNMQALLGRAFTENAIVKR
jgi:hypothetical protein